MDLPPVTILYLRISIMGEEEYETIRKVAYVFLHSSDESEGIEDLTNFQKTKCLEEHGVQVLEHESR